MQKYAAVALGFALVLCGFIFFVRMSATQGLSVEVYDVHFISEDTLQFGSNQANHEEYLPYITDAKIQHVSAQRMSIDVIYVVPKNVSKGYKISIMPNAGGFHNDDNILKVGKNKIRMNIYYSPDSIFKRGVKTSALDFYVRPREAAGTGALASSTLAQTVYQRSVEYEKVWRKPKHNPFEIGPAGFVVNGKDVLGLRD